MNPTTEKELVQKMELAHKLTEQFKKTFLEKLDIIPTVEYDLINDCKAPKLTLELLEIIINNVAKKRYSHLNIDNFIRTKRRKREAVLARQLYAYIGREHDFGLVRIGDSIGFDHATIIHSKKTVEDKLSIKDKLITPFYEEVIYEIEKRIASDGDVQFDRKEPSNSEPVLPFILDEGIY
jgi:chromosomal replication initiation ATPase DnaA